jgi:hypothetical protein
MQSNAAQRDEIVYRPPPPHASSGAAAAPFSTSTPVVSRQAADRIEGVWTGTYVCAQGITAGELLVSAPVAGDQRGVFRFGPLPGRTGASGAYEVRIGHDTRNGAVRAEPVRWIEQPPGFFMVPLAGALGRDGTIRGRIPASGCGEFVLRRDGSAGAAGRLAAAEAARSRPQPATGAGAPAGQSPVGAPAGQGQILSAAEARGLMEGRTVQLQQPGMVPPFGQRSWHLDGRMILSGFTGGRSALTNTQFAIDRRPYRWNGNQLCFQWEGRWPCVTVQRLPSGQLALIDVATQRPSYYITAMLPGDAFDFAAALGQRQRDWEALPPAERARREADAAAMEAIADALWEDITTPREPGRSAIDRMEEGLRPCRDGGYSARC